MTDLETVLAGAALSGVRVRLMDPKQWQAFHEARSAERAKGGWETRCVSGWTLGPASCESYARAGEVACLRSAAERADSHPPGWMLLLHEVAHAATAKEGSVYVGGESLANTWELCFCLAVWGPHSPQTRACTKWGSQGDWSISEVRCMLDWHGQTWTGWYQRGEE